MQLSPPPPVLTLENPTQKKKKWKRGSKKKKLVDPTQLQQQQLVQSSSSCSPPPPPPPPLRRRNQTPGVRIRGGRIFDSHNGKTCHQCRQKTMDVVAACKSQSDDRSCTIMFCQKCLLNRYGERTDEANQMDNWKCPKCRGCCNCSFCMKKRGHQPTGILVHAAKATGFRSVLEMLTVRGPETISSLLMKEKASNGKDDSFLKRESLTPPSNDKNVKRNMRNTIDIEGTKGCDTQLKKRTKKAYFSNKINLSVIVSEGRRNEMVDFSKKMPMIRQNFVRRMDGEEESTEGVDCGENMSKISQSKLKKTPRVRKSKMHHAEILENNTTGCNMLEGRKDNGIQSKIITKNAHLIIIDQDAKTIEDRTIGKQVDGSEEALKMRKYNMKKLARTKGYINRCNSGSQSSNNVEKPYNSIDISDTIHNEKKKANSVDGVDLEEHKIIQFCNKTTLDSFITHERLFDSTDSKMWIPEKYSEKKSTDLIKKEETDENHMGLIASDKNGRKDNIVDSPRSIANSKHKTEFDADTPLPHDMNLTTTSNMELPAEDALRFLEFCNAFGEELLSKAIQDKQVLEPNPCVRLEILASWCNVVDI